LYYRNNDAVMAVSVQTQPIFKVGKPAILFQGKYYSPWLWDLQTWDISPDGKRFLMMKSPALVGEMPSPESAPKINIVLNWFEELKERVPAP
jgi:hypothetical protein